MAKRIRERVQIGTDVNGKPIYEWATGYSRQEVFLNAAAILQKYGQIEGGPQKEPPKTPYFEAYMEEWWKLYKLPKLRHTTRTTYMKRNPTNSKRLFISSDKEQKREALEDSELRGIIGGIPCLKQEDGLLLALLIFTGMRRGEAIGLRWEDIDWKKRLIAVKRAVTYRNNRPVVGKTKSEAGNRIIPLDEQLAVFLQPCRQLNGYIIGNGEEPITETTFKRMWERIKKKINLYGATPHVFRHTYITLAASSGMDVKTLQSIAGHSDIKMTLDRYAHKRENNIIAAGGLIREVFRSM